MFKRATMACVTAALFLVPTLASAQVDLENAPGEVHIMMNLAYARVMVDGESWEETEFRKEGKMLVISGLNRAQEHTFEVSASEDGYDKVQFRIVKKAKYKKTRKKRVVSFVAKQTIRFKKTPPKTEEAPRAEEAPKAEEKPSRAEEAPKAEEKPSRAEDAPKAEEKPSRAEEALKAEENVPTRGAAEGEETRPAKRK